MYMYMYVCIYIYIYIYIYGYIIYAFGIHIIVYAPPAGSAKKPPREESLANPARRCSITNRVNN